MVVTPKPRAIVVGTGFGLRVHVPALRAGGFDVVALVGQDAERTRRRAVRAGVAAGYESLSAALVGTEADVVTIATPPDTHFDLAMQAIHAGKHVVCEKPMALSAHQAQAMTAAAAEAGVVGLVGNEFRWAPAVEAVRAAIGSGLVGQPHTVTLIRSYPILADAHAGAPSWWFDTARGGGWLRANGTHLLDQVCLWLGEIVEVTATVWQSVPRAGGEADDGYSMQFRTEGGTVGVIQECAAAWGDPVEMTRVAGTAGTLYVEDGHCFLATGVGVRRLTADPIAPQPDAVAGDPRPWTSQEIAAYTGLARWLHERLTRPGDRPATHPRPASFADGLAVLRVLDAIQTSAVERRIVHISPGAKERSL
jgi:predicted dehydrogenase